MGELTLDNVSKLLDSKLDGLEQRLNSKVDSIKRDITEFKIQVDGCIEEQNTHISAFQTRLDELTRRVELNAKQQNAKMFLNEYYSKRYNLLIMGINDAETKESKLETLKLARSFLRDTLEISDAADIQILDCHRLPQFISEKRSLRSTANEPSKPRPVIIKLASILDKNLIFKHTTNLKNANKAREKGLKYYVSEHLPKRMFEQKKSLMEEFYKAKDDGKKPYWKPDLKTCRHVFTYWEQVY